MNKMVKQWFVFALRDYKMGKGLFSASAEILPGAAFHAQQSIEKSLKGFLASKEVRAPKTHSLKN